MSARASRLLSRSRFLTPPNYRQHRPGTLTTLTQTFYRSTMPPKIAEGQDESKVKAEVDALLSSGWELDKEQKELCKQYHLKTYTKVQDLVNVIMIRSKSKNHHSVMTVEYGSLNVRWTTHKPHGLTDKDTLMARFCDEQANQIGTVDPSGAAKCGPAPSAQI